MYAAFINLKVLIFCLKILITILQLGLQLRARFYCLACGKKTKKWMIESDSVQKFGNKLTRFSM